MNRVIFSNLYKPKVIDDDELYFRLLKTNEWFNSPHEAKEYALNQKNKENKEKKELKENKEKKGKDSIVNSE